MKEPLIDLYRILQKLDEKLVLSRLPGLSPKVKTALKFVEENFSQEVRLEDAAARVRMHPVSLSRRVRKELRQHEVYISLPEYKDALRARMAKQLIKSNPFLECKEVAHMVGTSPRNLEKIFKRYVGVTPAEFRQMQSLE
jgi:two-component system response regulator YesN